MAGSIEKPSHDPSDLFNAMNTLITSFRFVSDPVNGSKRISHSRTIRKATLVYFLILSFLLTCFTAQSQTDTTGLVRYYPGFPFREGIYMNIGQFRSNQPIPFARIDFPGNPAESDYPEKLLKQKHISYYDANGVKIGISTEEIWGYSRMAAVFIQYNDDWQRVPVLGKASHFMGNVEVVNPVRQDPFYRNPYYFDPTRNATYTTKELRQLLLDVETGEILEYDRETIKIILMRDPELFDAYNSLSRRKQKQSMFLYLRKFNERNPLFFPPSK